MHARRFLADDLVRLKKQLVEQDCSGLIEFIESKRTLDDIYGQEKVKAWLRQDIHCGRATICRRCRKGYLLCGPVGTGKTFMVECLAGEAGVPIVKLKNFRDKWVGSTEGNLEKIFRLLQALGPLLRIHRRGRSGHWAPRVSLGRLGDFGTHLLHACRRDGQFRQSRQADVDSRLQPP